MAAKPGFDMRDRDPGHVSRQCSAERAGCIALNDQQVRRLAQFLEDGRGDAFDVRVRILLSGAIQPDGEICAEAIVGRVEAGMLAGEDQAWQNIASRERPGDGGKLDRFGAGADDKSDICRKQTSPSFGGINLRPQWTKCKLC